MVAMAGIDGRSRKGSSKEEDSNKAEGGLEGGFTY